MNDLGKKGEELAVRYLRSNGFLIHAVNWIYVHKEIDIIAEKDNMIHFVEVKARSYTRIVEPKEAVIRRKQRNIIQAADGYMKKYSIEKEACFDIISIVFYPNREELEHIPNAFEPNF